MILKDSQNTREQAARVVANGNVISFRTDTFYGLGADPMNQSAVRAIRRLKGREETKPILILVSDLDGVDRFIVKKSSLFEFIAKCHWPGPLTLVGVARPGLPEEVTSGTGTIGVRLPDGDDLRDLVRACGGALTATSANLAGGPPARMALEVQAYFPTGIELIVDGGKVAATQPSTVLDLSGPQPQLIREGAVSRIELQDTLAKLGRHLIWDESVGA